MHRVVIELLFHLQTENKYSFVDSPGIVRLLLALARAQNKLPLVRRRSGLSLEQLKLVTPLCAKRLYDV